MTNTQRQDLMKLVALILSLFIGGSWEALLQLDTLLAETMRSIPHLHVMLRRNQLLEDAANENARWFMQHTDTPHSTHLYDEQQPLGMTSDVVSLDSRHSKVLVVSLAQLIANTGAVRSAQRASVFFYIVGDQVGELSLQEKRELEHSCRQLWTRYRVYNRFILTDTQIWIYDPFA